MRGLLWYTLCGVPPLGKPMSRTHFWPGAALAVMSALLFGASTPLAKLLIGDGIRPEMLAGLFYLGAGIGLGAVQGIRRLLGQPNREAPLRRADLPRLTVAILLGGTLAPVLLLLGVARTSAAVAALLLNLEGVATMAIAWLVFRENVDKRLLLGALAISAGAVLLSIGGGWGDGALRGTALGSLLIAAACLAWGIDNNVTRGLSGADPAQITMLKGLVAGSINVALALINGARLPGPALMLMAALVGFFGYGISLTLFVRALRYLGAARTSAYFSTAPFLGALLALALFAGTLTTTLLIAGALMAWGVYLHLTESHSHEHIHGEMEHEHSHTHDEHHQHFHDAGVSPGEPHAHSHRHARLVHKHPHYPDLHHHHSH
jgi:drug/metabolite transporter (DMT)-like permease